MSPDSFLTDVHTFINKFREDRACGAREVGFGALRTGMSFFSLPSTWGQASGCPAPLHRAQGKAHMPCIEDHLTTLPFSPVPFPVILSLYPVASPSFPPHPGAWILQGHVPIFPSRL